MRDFFVFVGILVVQLRYGWTNTKDFIMLLGRWLGVPTTAGNWLIDYLIIWEDEVYWGVFLWVENGSTSLIGREGMDFFFLIGRENRSSSLPGREKISCFLIGRENRSCSLIGWEHRSCSWIGLENRSNILWLIKRIEALLRLVKRIEALLWLVERMEALWLEERIEAF